MIWMGNDLSLINDWETYLKGIHLQHGLDILLRWTGALERTHVLPVVSACSYASLRDHVRDVAEVPESIPLSPLLPLGNAICSDVDSSPPPVSLSSISSIFSIQLCLACSRLHSWADLWCAWLQHRYNVQTLSIRRSAKCVLMSACYCNCSLLISIDW